MKLALTVAVIGLALASAVRAATPFVVTLDDFSCKTIRVEALDATALSGTEGESKVATSLPIARLLVLEQSGSQAASQPTDAFVLIRHDGQRIVGKPGVIEKDALQFTTASTGEWRVPLTSIAAIARAAGREMSLPSTPLAQDELRLTNGDAVTGIVSESTSERVTCQSADGQAVPVDWANVRQVRFAQAAGDATPTKPAFRLALVDGSRIGVAELQINGGRLKARDGERTIDLDVASVRRMESLAGSTRLLANVSPASSTRAGYFPRFNAAGETDRAAAIAATSESTAAIAARPQSTMTWATDGAARFHARYVIPAGLSRADVSMRVRADDRVIFERSHVRSGDANPPIDLALDDAKSLTLEVDFGENYDVQDEFYWLDAALVGALAAK